MAVSRVPEIVVVKDYDGYFHRLTCDLVGRHDGRVPFRHRRITVDAMPFLPDAVQYRSDGATIHLLFYSAMHAGFGSLSEEDRDSLAALL